MKHLRPMPRACSRPPETVVTSACLLPMARRIQRAFEGDPRLSRRGTTAHWKGPDGRVVGP